MYLRSCSPNTSNLKLLFFAIATRNKITHQLQHKYRELLLDFPTGPEVSTCSIPFNCWTLLFGQTPPLDHPVHLQPGQGHGQTTYRIAQLWRAANSMTNIVKPDALWVKDEILCTHHQRQINKLFPAIFIYSQFL